MLIKKEAGIEAFNSKKQEKIFENCFSNFCEFQLISEGVAPASAVYTCLECKTKVLFTFVPRSFSEQTVFNQFASTVVSPTKPKT